MTQELKDKWVAALRSGDYVQNRGEIEDMFDGGLCCLGVLGKVSRHKRSIRGYDLVDGGTRDVCVWMNDEEKKSFIEIADWVEANVVVDS